MNKQTKNLTLSAIFIALGLVLPFFIGQIPEIGNLLLPMHIPVLLCGLICGWKHGLLVGFFLPILRHLIFGMPPMPGFIAMAFELGTYGFLTGWLYDRAKKKNIVSVYTSMLIAMLAGRVVWGVVQYIVLGLRGTGFTWQMFMAGAFFNAIPGIILQLVLIPAVMVALDKAKFVPFSKA